MEDGPLDDYFDMEIEKDRSNEGLEGEYYRNFLQVCAAAPRPVRDLRDLIQNNPEMVKLTPRSVIWNSYVSTSMCFLDYLGQKACMEDDLKYTSLAVILVDTFK